MDVEQSMNDGDQVPVQPPVPDQEVDEVERLSAVQLRYARLSDLFKSAWTFHQFVQGVNKVFSDRGLNVAGLPFQGIYGTLKSLSKHLHTSAADGIESELELAAGELDALIEQLLEVDRKIETSLLRRFFSRVKKYDNRILLQLLRFQLLTRDKGWDENRQDKVDFLMTRIGEELLEPSRPALEQDRSRWRDAASGLWKIVGDTDFDAKALEDAVVEIRTLREAMLQIDTLEQLNQLGLITTFRRVKHRLGPSMFHPRVIDEVLETNLFLRNAVQSFYEREERRIASQYQEVFELERGAADVDAALDGDLRVFRDQVEDLEKGIAREDVKLDKLMDVSTAAADLIPRLRGGEDEPDSEAQASALEPGDGLSESGLPQEDEESRDERLPAEKPTETLRIRTAHAEVLGSALRRLLLMLEDTDWKADPRAIARMDEARPLRLHAREVLAYRRLHRPEEFDRELEQMILEVAALRTLLSGQAEELVGLGDVDALRQQVVQNARVSCRLAGQFENRCRHFMEQSLLDGDVEEARVLQFLRMRLLRDYTGLWLLTYKGTV